MSNYAITVSPDEATEEYRVTLVGPGLAGNGRKFIFRSTERAARFEDAINFAYSQGLRDGAQQERDTHGRLWLVSGSLPDNLELRKETFWERLRRRAGL